MKEYVTKKLDNADEISLLSQRKNLKKNDEFQNELLIYCKNRNSFEYAGS